MIKPVKSSTHIVLKSSSKKKVKESKPNKNKSKPLKFAHANLVYAKALELQEEEDNLFPATLVPGRTQKPTKFTGPSKLMLYKAIRTMFGMQIPKIRVPFGVQSLTSDGFGEMAYTFSCPFSDVIGSSDYAAIFDEYRLVKAEARYVSWFTHTDVSSTQTNRLIGGYVDLDDATAPTSLQQCWNHLDTCLIENTNENFVLRAHANLQGSDRNWITTATTTGSPFYFKFYSDSVPASTTIGAVLVWGEYEFRAVQ